MSYSEGLICVFCNVSHRAYALGCCYNLTFCFTSAVTKLYMLSTIFMYNATLEHSLGQCLDGNRDLDATQGLDLAGGIGLGPACDLAPFELGTGSPD